MSLSVTETISPERSQHHAQKRQNPDRLPGYW
jgi:hypothetical protein